MSIEEFRGQLLEEIGTTRALENQEIGLAQKEVGRFSMMRAIHALAKLIVALKKPAFEFEASRAAARQYGVTAQGIMLPAEVLRNWKRDMSAGSDVTWLPKTSKAKSSSTLWATEAQCGVLVCWAVCLGVGPKNAASTAAFVAVVGCC